MIKINLKNTKTSISNINTMAGFSGEQGQGKAAGTFSQMSAGLQKIDWSSIDAGILLKIAFNIILVLSILLGLKIYEIRSVNRLKATLSLNKKTLEDKKQILEKINVEINSLGKYEKEAQEFDSKKSLFKKLADQRLQIPRLLDQIQSAIPRNVWLKSIKISVKEGDISISGESINEDKVTKFVNDLGSGIINSNTAQFDTSDLISENSANKIKFNVTGKLLAGSQQ